MWNQAIVMDSESWIEPHIYMNAHFLAREWLLNV